MKTFKKALFIILSIVMVFSSTAYASVQTDISKEINMEKKTSIYINTMTEAQREAERNRQLQEQFSQLNPSGDIIILNDPEDYKHVWGTSVKASTSGYAGNQPDWTRFPTGGGFYYSSDGGPSASISVSLPKPLGLVSFSVNLGNSSTSGKFVNVPNTTQYFKLYVQRNYSVTPYTIFKRVVDEFNGETWVEYSSGYSKILDTTDAWAKARP